MKFGPSGKYGVFLGYKVLSGGKWRNEVYAATLEDLASQDLSYFANSSLSKTHVQTVRIKEIVLDKSKDHVQFPFAWGSTTVRIRTFVISGLQ